ncbi:Cation/H(+) antiporter 15 [Camellia lanceoleosa]|nr:Cation/H(+) antiporter 15 [Camellia lanceoleosa]
MFQQSSTSLKPPTPQKFFCIYVLHLVEAHRRAFAMLIVHPPKARSPPQPHSKPNPTKLSMPLKTSNNAITCVSNPLTAISLHHDARGHLQLGRGQACCLHHHSFSQQRTVDGGIQLPMPHSDPSTVTCWLTRHA